MGISLVLKDIGQAQNPGSNTFWQWILGKIDLCVCVCSVPSTGVNCVTRLYIGMETVKQWR